MNKTASDVMIDTLLNWGVEFIFGLPGDGINGIMEALRKRQDKIRFIQVRHEESAALMACGYAKYTGKLGVCLATSGPGGLHLLNGLYDAKMDGQPVLAITGHHYHDLINTHSQQDVDLDKVFMDVAGYNTRVMGTAHVETVTNLACRAALRDRAVSHITFPVDFQSQKAKNQGTFRNIPHHTSDVFSSGIPLPSRDNLDQAAALLNEGQKVVILAGRGALKASKALEKVAAKLSAPIVKALLGKAVVADDHPLTTGCIGLLGTKPSQEVMEDCDTLLMVGTSFPYMEYLPQPGQAKGIQIDIDPARIGLRYPVDVALASDSRLTLDALLPRLQEKEDQSFLQQTQAKMQDWRELMDQRENPARKPLKPQIIAHSLGQRLDDNAIVSCDSGTVTAWWARHIAAKQGQMHSVSGMMASMACGMNYTIASQLAYPDRQCVAFVGDGGFSMLMAEFATCVKYNLPIKIIVIKNNSLGQIKWEQMLFLGNPEYGCDLESIDYAAFARACGGQGFTIDDPESCGDILDEALAVKAPVIIDAIVDPLEFPIPAKMNQDQAQKLAQSMMQGEPNAEKIALTVLSGQVKEMI
ncbi:MAG: thiamine pyrophosphate-dependent enzyme [Spirulinaceae cyanobacterium]